MAATASGIRAGAAYVELSLKDNLLTRGLNAVAARLQAFGMGISAVGSRVQALAATLGAPLMAGVHTFAAVGEDMLAMSQRTGLTVEALSELRYAASRTSVEAEALERGLRIMARNLVEAARAPGPARDALARLGITIADLSGLSPDQQFQRIAESIARLPNPLQRTAAAMDIFGRSGANLLPLLTQGSQGIDALRRRAGQLGATWTTEDAQAAREFGKAWAGIAGALKRVSVAVGAALAPLMVWKAQLISSAINAVRVWIKEHTDLIKIIDLVVIGLGALGIGLIVLGKIVGLVGGAFSLLSTLLGVIGSIAGGVMTAIGLLLTPLGLVTAAVGGLTAAILLGTNQGQAALTALGAGFSNLVGIAGTAWQGIKDAIAAGDLEGALEVVWLGLQAIWAEGVAALSQAWRNFSNYLIEVWAAAVYGLAGALNTGWTNLEAGFWVVVNALATGWDHFVAGLKIAFNEFVGFFQRAWARVRNLFSPETARAEVERINAAIAAQNQAATAGLDEAARAREQNVGNALQRGRQRQQALDQMEEAERQQRQRDLEAGNAADAAEAQQIRQRLEERTRELQRAREMEEIARMETGGAATPERRSEFTLQEGLEQAVAKTDVKGTFNALALFGLGGDTLAERTARASEATAANTRRLIDEARRQGLVFE